MMSQLTFSFPDSSCFPEYHPSLLKPSPHRLLFKNGIKSQNHHFLFNWYFQQHLFIVEVSDFKTFILTVTKHQWLSDWLEYWTCHMFLKWMWTDHNIKDMIWESLWRVCWALLVNVWQPHSADRSTIMFTGLTETWQTFKPVSKLQRLPVSSCFKAPAPGNKSFKQTFLTFFCRSAAHQL